ncbi:unnamed protein product [Cuscuta epithymum]|uniref:Aminoacyl-tRNA synthetase class I anticodon-binding domain-containing protein n=1 Tax=Cuscuta epithymum TaxID=186058 RepID=A0AAV0E4M3_9ASTE|nr:unnamed protein product [Cuscuta epithymum]
MLLKDGIDLINDSEKVLSNLLCYPFNETLTSPEGKSLLDDGLHEVADSLLAAYSSGELFAALDEGQPGWQKWVKSFGKALERKGKSLFMPLRVLLTGKLHGPDMGSSIVLLYKAGNSGAVASHVGFISLDERFKVIREVDWESFSKDPPIHESAAGASIH